MTAKMLKSDQGGNLHSWTSQRRLPKLYFRDFLRNLTRHLPPLLDFLRSDELRHHPLWRRLIPFETQAYGEGRSLGHCIRPDLIITPEGVRICEFDFVPSGRGFILSALPEDDERRTVYLNMWARWYREMHANQVQYATATTTTCWDETVLFAQALQDTCGTDITAVNIDEAPVNGALIDRLFYRAEMRYPGRVQGLEVVTMEPHLDSKMLFALIHDPAMERILVAAIGIDAVLFFREVCPPTYALDILRDDRPAFLEQIARERAKWLIKNTDVEDHDCWGARGVAMGRKFNNQLFREALFRGVNPGNKRIGSRPVVQQFAGSMDFGPIWDAVVSGELRRGDGQSLGFDQDSVVTRPATRPVYARVGAYLLVSNRDSSVLVPPVGILTLRQDELAHGSTDAVMTAFSIA